MDSKISRSLCGISGLILAIGGKLLLYITRDLFPKAGTIGIFSGIKISSKFEPGSRQRSIDECKFNESRDSDE